MAPDTRPVYFFRAILDTYLTSKLKNGISMTGYVEHPLIRKDAVASRLYQRTLADVALMKSSLIVLPTGLGKTIIALLVIAERLNKDKDGKVLILSPTKPLVEQHAAFFKKAMTIDPDMIATFTGSTPPEKRKRIWDDSRIIVSTPQVIENDLLTGRLDLKSVIHITFDEAHRATGNYSYVYIAKRYHEQAQDPLVLGITASPGSTAEKINEIKENLSIERVELKTENDADVAPYIHDKEVEWIKVDVPDMAFEIKVLLDAVLDDRLVSLKKLGAIYSENHVSKRDLLALQAKLHASLNSGGSPEGFKAVSILAEVMKVEHAVDLIQTQGVLPLRRYFERLKQEAEAKGGSKASKRLMQDARLLQAIKVAEGADEVSPKTEKVKEIVLEMLRENPASKVIVFTNFRDTAEIVTRSLSEIPGITPIRFVGQASRLNDKGLSQKRQVEILDAFREGKYNTLIATSVAEEGLDIPSTDMVLFYEPVPSEIRTIQRRGRTGRNAVGRVVVLMSKGTRDEGVYRISQQKEKKMYRTMRDMKDGQNMTDIIESGEAPEAQPGEELKPAGQAKLDVFKEETPEPKPEVEIYVDTREMRSPAIKALQDMKASLRFMALEAGDYLLSDRVCVERKTVDDFLGTLFDREKGLFEQVIALKREYIRPILIIEGDGLYTRRNIHPNVIRGILASVAVDFGIQVLFTAGPEDTAAYLYTIARREQMERKRSVAPHTHKTSQTLAEQQEYIVSAITEVGPVISKNLLAHFGSVKGIVNASEEELKAVDKVGEKTARRIRELIDAQYRPH